jgi:hypothetical protein
MNELQQQNAQLYAAAAVNKSKISELKEKLAAEEGRSEIFTDKLESNKAVFEKMYKELGSLVNNSESTIDSQVIHLQADYKGQGDNMAV